jgi:hypothetical protein
MVVSPGTDGDKLEQGIVVDYVRVVEVPFVCTGRERDGALMRRAAWQYPKGIRVIAEYWPIASAVQVISIFSVDTFEQAMELELEWSDVFDIDVHPAVSVDEGLRIGAEVIERLPRMQQA